MCMCACVRVHSSMCVSHDIIYCLGLPGAPPPPSLSVINVTMVKVRWESPDDTGNLNISHFQVCVYVCSSVSLFQGCIILLDNIV